MVVLLTAKVQSLAARREDAQLRRATKQRLGEARARIDEGFAVVEHEEQLVRLEVLAERLRKCLAGLFVHAQHLGDGVRNERWILERSKIYERDAVGKFIQHVGGDLQR